ncbi:transmembrane emp24 domain-containing protein 5 [Bombyx mori]|uniref:Transmembrane emp24 domain-containing protein n=1 Tax=Bombyx mori TaxID=7091 RepID=A0A8R2G7B3_BOMMO|nr:transmembrane emp24 domain-containing protein 5 [Bombyx mori]WIM49492.1 transmembrane emp24 domain-containing protein [Bombyx mori]
MHFIKLCAITIITSALCLAQAIYESDVNFRIEPGSRTCFFEKGESGHILEVFYQVIDGQHGDLDISFDVIDPNGVKLISDYKKPENSIIIELDYDGDYAFCMDNTYSVLNSKLVFVYVSIEAPENKKDKAAPITFVDDAGNERIVEEVLQWMGTDENGKTYYLDIEFIAESLLHTLKLVLRARHLLDRYGAAKSRDSYLAVADTFIVDVWSAFQITFMCIVGMLQVYMIKQLFNKPYTGLDKMY